MDEFVLCVNFTAERELTNFVAKSRSRIKDADEILYVTRVF